MALRGTHQNEVKVEKLQKKCTGFRGTFPGPSDDMEYLLGSVRLHHGDIFSIGVSFNTSFPSLVPGGSFATGNHLSPPPAVTSGLGLTASTSSHDSC